jgi:hypothetical protein
VADRRRKRRSLLWCGWTSPSDRVKCYAALPRQPLSVVIRDALTLLMEEYPLAAGPSGPQRPAAHAFLSDRYESPLETLIGETDSAELEAFLSGTQEEVVGTILSDAHGDTASTSDTQEELVARTSDSTSASAATHTGTSARRRPRKGAVRKMAQAVPRAWHQAKRAAKR